MISAHSNSLPVIRRKRLVIFGTLLAVIGILLGLRVIQSRTVSIARGDTPTVHVEPAQLEAQLTGGVSSWPKHLARDPFARHVDTAPLDPDAAQREARSKLTLGTILLSDNPRAVINGSILCEGDEIMGYQVLRIERHVVVMEYNGVQIELNP